MEAAAITDTSTGSAPAATIAPRCASARRSRSQYRTRMHATARSCTEEWGDHMTQHRAPVPEIHCSATAQCTRVASDVEAAAITDTSTGSAPAATIAPRCASARRSRSQYRTRMHATARSCTEERPTHSGIGGNACTYPMRSCSHALHFRINGARGRRHSTPRTASRNAANSTRAAPPRRI